MAKVVQMNLKIPAQLRTAIRAQAKIKGMKINVFLERIISDGLQVNVQPSALTPAAPKGE